MRQQPTITNPQKDTTKLERWCCPVLKAYISYNKEKYEHMREIIVVTKM